MSDLFTPFYFQSHPVHSPKEEVRLIKNDTLHINWLAHHKWLRCNIFTFGNSASIPSRHPSGRLILSPSLVGDSTRNTPPYRHAHIRSTTPCRANGRTVSRLPRNVSEGLELHPLRSTSCQSRRQVFAE